MADLWRDSGKCPECGGEHVSLCRCPLGDMTCANGHHWHHCPTCGVRIAGKSDHKAGTLAHRCGACRREKQAKGGGTVAAEAFAEMAHDLGGVFQAASEGSRLRRMAVNSDLLAQALLLPEGTEIVGVEHDMASNRFVFMVRNPAFTPVAHGMAIPAVHPQYSVRYVKEPKFDGWEE